MADLRTTLTILGKNETKGALREVRSDMRGLGTQLQDLRRNALALAGVTLSIGGVAGLFSQVRGLADELDRLGKVAGRLNIDPGLLAGFGFVAERSGIQIAVMEKALADLQRRAGESALGLGEARQAFEMLGIDAASFIQLGLDRQMAILADAFANVAEEETKAAIAARVFGESGVQLLQALNGGSQAVGELIAQGRAYSGVTQENAEAAAAFNDALTNLGTQFAGLRNQAIGPLLDDLAGGVEGLAENFDEIVDSVQTFGTVLLAVFGGRVLGAFTAYSAAQAKAVIDSRRLAAATLEGLRAKQADALAARAAAVANLNMARVMDQATGGMARQAVAAREVAAAHAAYAAAANASATAAGRLSVAAAAGRGALALLGGPVGAITTGLLLGVTAWSAYGNEAQAAARDLESFNDTADRLLGNLDAITRRQIESAVQLGESTIAGIEARIRVVSAALQSSRDEQRTIELRRELVDLQQQEIEQGDKLAALRNRLATIGTQQNAQGGTGLAGAVGTENKALETLIKDRDKLIADLKAVDNKLTAGPDPATRSSAANIARLNTLRGQAGGSLERGDQEGALRQLQEAQQVIAALQESGQASTGYLQTQIRLVGELAARVGEEDVTPQADPASAEASLTEYTQIRDEFLRQNPGRSLIEVDYAASRDMLSQAIERLQQEASQNAITVPVQAAPVAAPAAPAFATGGLMRGPGTGTSDSILARLSAGEYVVKAAAVRRYGLGMLEQLNSMRLPKYRTGGLVRDVPRYATGGPVQAGAPIYFDLNGQRYTATLSGQQVPDIRAGLQAELRKRGVK